MKKQDSLVGVMSFAAVSVGAAILSACSYFKDRKEEEKRAAGTAPLMGQDETETPDDRGVTSVIPPYASNDKAKVIKAVGEITGLGTMNAGFLLIDAQWQSGDLSWTKAVLIFSMAGDSVHREAANQKLIEWNSKGVQGKRLEEIRGFLTEMQGKDLEDPSVAWAEIESVLGKYSTRLSADSDETERHLMLEQFLELFPAIADYTQAQREIIRSMVQRLNVDRATMLRVCREIWSVGAETPEAVDRDVEELAQRWDALAEEC